MPTPARSRRQLLKGLSALLMALTAQASSRAPISAEQPDSAQLTVTIDLKDFMDGSPLDDAEVTVVVNLVPRFRTGVPVNLPQLTSLPAPVIQYSESAIRRISRTARRINTIPGRYSASIPSTVIKSAINEMNGAVSLVIGRYIGPALVLSLRVRCRNLDREIRYFAGLRHEDGVQLLDVDASVRKVIALDFAKSIVGHTSADAVTLWFCSHGESLSQDLYQCVIEQLDASVPDGRSTILPRELPITFDAQRGNTAVITAAGLRPETPYRYELQLLRAGTRSSLATGSFRTASLRTDRLAVAFGSCHEPAGERSLNRWEELAHREDYDLLLLMGDQVYGDAVANDPTGRGYFEQYLEIYHQYWKYWPMRQVLRNTPTYMTLDDHEANDDWGTKEYSDEFPEEREQAALDAYRAFQHPLHAGSYEGPIHYSFNRGPAAFFVMDSRTARSPRPESQESPILGQQQLADFRAWAQQPETRAADVIFFIAPVPLAWLPVETLRRLVNQLQTSTRTAGVIAGGLAGYAPAGGVGAYAGAAVGGLITDGITELDVRTGALADFTRWDLQDQWTFAPNQRDLVHVLDTLFDLANDIQADGSPGPRPRAVFILGGDVHSGAMHVISSTHRGGGQDHSRNPFIFQLTSSAISNEPASEKIYAEAIGRINAGAAIRAWDIIAAGGDRDALARKGFNSSPVRFFLDDQGAGAYAAELIEFLTTRSYGRIEVERVSPDQRIYRIGMAVEGEEVLGDQQRIRRSFEVDLDAPRVFPVEV